MNRSEWNSTWQRSHERYNRHHQAIWDRISRLNEVKGNVVDLGCGPCVFWQGKIVSLVGIDWSEEALKRAKIHYPCGVYILADIRRTGLPSGQFDLVVLLGVLDYYENWDEVLIEARRLKKPEGKIFATLLNGHEGHDWTKFSHVTSNWYYYLE